MDNSPLLSHNTPRFAPPRMHVRNASQSPTRKRFADDLLSDLSPATTLEAFTNPSGKLKASIEAASSSERAFGIRATTASKKIQEWVYELSNWPWPAEGGSVGFEMPATKRRKLSDPFIDSSHVQNYEKTGMSTGDEPEYIGSLLAEEVDCYELRIDEIHAEMEDLNVEDIKRQVLDTHFSPRSRPSSSASNAPMPQFLTSYTKMDDFTAIVTSTVLQSLPNLSRLMRLLDVWTIRLSVLRKVPPLLLEFEDTEVALKSGWNAIRHPTENESLSRETFDVMRNVLREQLTTLGRDLDYLLDTLEGREDTLPDSWLDRMEIIENDYGSWDVAADRKVREGEWAKLAKKRKDEEDARRLREEEEAEMARRKAEQEAREDAERLARQRAEDEERQKAESEAREAEAAEVARLQALQEAARFKAQLEAEALEAARLNSEREAAYEAARIQAEQEAPELSRRQAEEEPVRQEAEKLEAARTKAEQEARDLAKRKAEEEEEAARLEAQQEAEKLEAARIKAEQEAEAAARQEAEQEARDLAKLKAEEEEAARIKAQYEYQQAEAARLKAVQDAEDEAIRKAEADEAARQKAEQEARHLAKLQAEETARLKDLKDAEEEAIRKAQLEAELAETDRLRAEQEAERIASRQAEEAAVRRAQQDAEQAEIARFEAEREAETAAIQKSQSEAEAAELQRLEAQRKHDDQIRLLAEQEALATELAEQQARKNAEARAAEAIQIQIQEDLAKRKLQKEAEDPESFHLQSESETEEPAAADNPRREAPENARLDPPTVKAEKDEESDCLETELADPHTAATSDPSKQSPDCLTCTELQHVDESASLHEGTRVPMGSAPSTQATTLNSSFSDALKPSISRCAPYDGIYDDDPAPPLSIPNDVRLEQESSKRNVVMDSPIHLDKRRDSTAPACPVRSAVVSSEEPVTPPSQKIPRFGHAFANALRRASLSPQSSKSERPHSSPSSHREYPDNGQDYESPSPRTIQQHPPPKPLFHIEGADDSPSTSQAISMKSNEDGWVVISSSDEEDTHYPETGSLQSSEFGTLDRPSSFILGCSATDPTLERQEAEPADYFQPALTPVKTAGTPASELAAPLKDFDRSPAIHIDEALLTLDGPASPGSPFISSTHGVKAVRAKRVSPTAGDECEVCDSIDYDPEVETSASEPVMASKQSISHIANGVHRISIPRRDSISSEASTIITPRADELPSSPLASPITDSFRELFSGNGDTSPSDGRIGHRTQKSYDLSPPDSPKRGKLSPQRSLQILRGSNLSPLDSSLPSTPIDAPIFENLDVSTAPILSSPKKATTDDQIQQQISSLLESIPARIRLTSEPASPAFATQALRPKKTRRSITPNARPSSSMSNYSTSTTYSRAATPGPQFTLAPAFAKTGQRTRTHNGNPEIKLYHLSRSTGEAPIKLFVRLVGEHGERVMVRVGGGWADLGEYLKEYASHHGRRSAADAGDMVEIQDLPPRVVSTSSTTSTLRGSGRDTPGPRPFSVLERERPMSSLNVRKTRKSIGDHDPSPIPSRINDTRSPSTPLPLANRRAFDTPPSIASAASVASSNSGTGSNGRSSRMSWTEEDSSLGLAGPKSKKIVISERDQEWVESMKEKVRLASAEKEKRERVERDRKTSFGEMDKVGGTKRLFRKG